MEIDLGRGTSVGGRDGYAAPRAYARDVRTVEEEATRRMDQEDRLLQERVDRACCLRGDLLRHTSEFIKRACAGAAASYIVAHPLQRENPEYRGSDSLARHASGELRYQRFILLETGSVDLARVLGRQGEGLAEAQQQIVRQRFSEQVHIRERLER